MAGFKSFPKDEMSPQNEPKAMPDLIQQMVQEGREEQQVEWKDAIEAAREVVMDHACKSLAAGLDMTA